MKKKLYKSNKFRLICGVCGGWAEMLNWDPTIIRIIFVILSFFKGAGIFLYFVLAFITPSALNSELEEDNAENSEVTKKNKSAKKKSNSKSKDGIHTDKEFDSFFDNKKDKQC